MSYVPHALTPNPYLPHEVEILERIEECAGVFTLRLRFTDADRQRAYTFAPGQFNMVYLYGVGEVPISIVSDPMEEDVIDHTIRAIGRVTRGIERLRAGDRLALRGPFGRGWPVDAARGLDVLLVTGGLGCAPLVSVINYIMRRRAHYGRLTIMQGVKHASDLIFRQRFEGWSSLPNVKILLAADTGSTFWPWHEGRVTDLFDEVHVDAARTLAMMCGPEGMMRVALGELARRGMRDRDIYLSMERSMHCAVGHCGHCQFGPRFVCRDGPVFSFEEIREWFGEKGV